MLTGTLSVELLVSQDSLALYWIQNCDAGLWSRCTEGLGEGGRARGAGAGGTPPRLHDRPRLQPKHEAGLGRVGGQYLAQSGLPHWDSRAGSLRTFLCHLY